MQCNRLFLQCMPSAWPTQTSTNRLIRMEYGKSNTHPGVTRQSSAHLHRDRGRFGKSNTHPEILKASSAHLHRDRGRVGGRRAQDDQPLQRRPLHSAVAVAGAACRGARRALPAQAHLQQQQTNGAHSMQRIRAPNIRTMTPAECSTPTSTTGTREPQAAIKNHQPSGFNHACQLRRMGMLCSAARHVG